MTEVKINNPPPTTPVSVPVETSGTDRTAAATINFLTVLLVLVAVIGILWFLFTGPFRVMSATPTVNVNPPAQQAPTNINVNPPAKP